MEDIYLTDFFTTKSQANDFSAHISAISAQIFEVDFDLEKVLHEQLGVKKKEKFISLLRENKIPPGSDTALNLFFSKIQTAISSLPVATITMAIEPSQETLKAISDWFLLNLKHQVIIDVQIDSQLIAGAIVHYQGKHNNYSILSEFENISSAILDNAKQQA